MDIASKLDEAKSYYDQLVQQEAQLRSQLTHTRDEINRVVGRITTLQELAEEVEEVVPDAAGDDF